MTDHGKKKHNKLVRDKIPDIIRLRGGCPIVRKADEEEYWHKLQEKLKEEVHEFLEAKETHERKEELADVLEVIQAIACHLKCGVDELEILRVKKAEERGGFEGRVILDETT
jgi:predicted house-cleaning noncanonical NTP pyrophosphatase (MazG superfamily)